MRTESIGAGTAGPNLPNLSTRPLLVERESTLATLTTLPKPKDITDMTDTRLLSVLEPWVGDRRQSEGAGGNVPGVTTEPVCLSDLRAQHDAAAGGTWHSSRDALVLLEVAESVKALQLEGWDFRSPTMDLVLAALRKVRP